MAGFSNAPFRLICSEYGADFCVTEMVSADGLVRGGEKTKRIFQRMDGEAPLGVQLFGSDPDIFAEAALILVQSAPAFIDLNFGCPVKKVIRKNGGAAIMRDLALMEKIVSAVVEAVDLPVTAKIRSGWNEAEQNFVEAGKVIENSGAVAVVIHPRYRAQGFTGEADWNHISRLREAVSIHVIANGDVNNADDYLKIVDETGCSIVMIGRGAFGCPWIFRDIKDRLCGREPSRVSLEEKIDVLERIFRMEMEWKGARGGLLEMRKFYKWFLKGHSRMKDYRRRLSVALTEVEVLDILTDLREEIEPKWKRPV